MKSLEVRLGPAVLSTPLVVASGTLGSIVEFGGTVDLTTYGAATAKSVAPEAWEGRPAPRMAPTYAGMLNGIGVQNPGIDAWLQDISPMFGELPTDIWGSIVAHDVDGFAEVAAKMSASGVAAIEINLSCPNLDGQPFGLDPVTSGAIVEAVRAVTTLPIGAKLSPDALPISAVADAAMTSGADWLVIANTVMGAAIDPKTRRPALSGLIGGYSGAAVRPITIRCVIEVARDVPEAPIVGCGGVRTAEHVVEYVLAGADAVAIGTAHFSKPRIAAHIIKNLQRYLKKHSIESIASLKGAYEPW